MINKKQIIALAAPLSIMAGLAVIPNRASAGYLVDTSGKIVLDGYKECWQGIWTDPGMSALCGDATPVKRVVQTVPVYGDSDGDGITDNLDRCPNSRTTNVDSRGCALDSDGDGVANYLDRCPSTPRGTSVDSKGCSLDSDDDGVVDGMDNCPNTAAGLKVDSHGCHIIESMTIRLNVEGFDTNSARLRPAMMAALDEIASRILASEGNESLSVIGHTDSRGSDSYNQSLSERRAESVVNYLADKGLDRGMMSSSGMGESSPVGDNSTRAGRAANRRVEIQTR